MKILFLAFASNYTPGMDYQDNCFCESILSEGNEVVLLSNPEQYVDGILKHVGSQVYYDKGLKIIRFEYKNIISKKLSRKIRAFKNVYNVIVKENPDIIFCHGINYLPILDVVKYKKKHMNVSIYADTHASYNNSATNWISLNILHKIYYRSIYKKIEKYLTKFFYIGYDEKIFAKEVYRSNNEIMEFLPLGGKIPSENEYLLFRQEKRRELNIENNVVLFVHSGKLDKMKKTTELINAFNSSNNINARLVIIGSIPEDTEKSIKKLIDVSANVEYIGWKENNELRKYLCACDVYCQPGSVSATFQNAICCRCAILSYPHKTYKENYDKGNIMWASNEIELINAINTLSNNIDMIKTMSKISSDFSINNLDYNMLIHKFI